MPKRKATLKVVLLNGASIQLTPNPTKAESWWDDACSAALKAFYAVKDERAVRPAEGAR